MGQVIRITEQLYARLKEHAHGFDTPANVIERILNYYEGHCADAPETKSKNPEEPNALPTSLDLTYRPNGKENFKRALLEKKQAYVCLYKMDGSSEVKAWNASRFSPDSSVNANLRSGYLRNWKEKGIFKAVITVDEPRTPEKPIPGDPVEKDRPTIRRQAKIWLAQNYPESASNPLRASKYHPEQDIWFFTFPSSYFDSLTAGDLNIFLQYEHDPNQFHFLKVPFSFFRDNKRKFAIRESGDKFDLHISAKKRNWLTCERSNGVSFRKYEQ